MKKAVNFRLDEEIVEALERLAAEHGTLTAAMTAAVAEQAKARMLGDPDTPLDPAYLEGMGPAAVAGLFVRFSEARTGKSELYRLERPPSGGYWAEAGIQGYRVMAAWESFTPNGLSHDARTYNRLHYLEGGEA